MAFGDIPKVENYDTYLDIAFKNGKSTATSARQLKISDKIKRSRHIERMRMESTAKSLMNTLDMLVKRFPHVDELAPFYQELFKCTLDVDQYKKSLGALNWAKQQIKSILIQTIKKINLIEEAREANKVRQSFSGRVGSIFEQIKKDFSHLEEYRKIMKKYPSLKTGKQTIVLAGAPNVGKSTLLAILTGSKPETATYPFTTKNLNLGYDSKGRQYIDTPGLLDRPLKERNAIEMHGILALKHLANIIIFIVDATETCGYKLPEQEALLKDVKKRFSQPVLLVSNKADVGSTYKNAIAISAKTGQGIPELKEQISAALSQQTTQTSSQ